LSIAVIFLYGKTVIAGLPDAEKSFNTVHKCDGWTDRRTPHDSIDCAVHSVARQKPDCEILA